MVMEISLRTRSSPGRYRAEYSLNKTSLIQSCAHSDTKLTGIRLPQLSAIQKQVYSQGSHKELLAQGLSHSGRYARR